MNLDSPTDSKANMVSLPRVDLFPEIFNTRTKIDLEVLADLGPYPWG